MMGQPIDVPPHFHTFLAFDFGAKRTGVAVGNRLLGTATPQATIRAEATQARLDAAAERVKQWQPDALVVGVPFHPDGASHDNTARARRFGRQLAARVKLPVYEVDERYSTTEACTAACGDLDAASAAVILDQILRERSMPEASAP